MAKATTVKKRKVLRTVKKAAKKVANTTFIVTVKGEGTVASKRTMLENRLPENCVVTSLTARGIISRYRKLKSR